MPANTPQKIENSYQKEERLRNELKTTIKEIKYFLSIFMKDAKETDESFVAFSSVQKRIDELRRQEDELNGELKKIKAELSNFNESPAALNNKVNLNFEKQLQINSLREKSAQISYKIDTLLNEMSGIVQEESDRQGDTDGIMSIIKTRIVKAEKLKSQLEEL